MIVSPKGEMKGSAIAGPLGRSVLICDQESPALRMPFCNLHLFCKKHLKFILRWMGSEKPRGYFKSHCCSFRDLGESS
ncbi:unnamed protein product [Rhodiola kirilowii]